MPVFSASLDGHANNRVMMSVGCCEPTRAPQAIHGASRGGPAAGLCWERKPLRAPQARLRATRPCEQVSVGGVYARDFAVCVLNISDSEHVSFLPRLMMIDDTK